MTTHITREAWLMAAAERIMPWIVASGGKANAYQVSAAFPSVRGLSAKSRRIGEAWNPAACQGVAQVFVHPALDVPAALATLVHELVHVAVGNEYGHRGPFAKVARAVGLAGKLTATHAGTALQERLYALAAEIGAYPQGTFTPSLSGRKVQSTRMLKLICPDCGYTCRTTAKWIEVGFPTCPCGTTMIDDINSVDKE